MQTELDQLKTLQSLYWFYYDVILNQNEFREYFHIVKQWDRLSYACANYVDTTIRGELWRVHFKEGTIHKLNAPNGSRD